nr:integrase, catalytic region, zinc finger, CCHC-type, peptidase aspartic, catalytic [Tanacetum cinerariifolium]
RIIQTDKGTEFLNSTLHAYFASEGILHQTSVARTPEQNGVVKRWNRTLVEAARTMLSATKVPLFFWAEAIATSCFTQNRSLVIPRHEKTPYHIINDRKPSVKFFHIFGSLCYIVRDGKNLDKIKEKGDACILLGYSVFNKRTRVIVETIHVNFDELPQMASDHVSSDPVPPCQRTTVKNNSLSPGPQCQKNVTQADMTVTMSNELDLLFSLMFDELLNGSSQVVSKSSVVTSADTPNHRQQQHTTPLNNQATPEQTCQVLTQAPTITSTENINQAEIIKKYAQVENNEFINIFCTPIQDKGERSSRHVDSSNMHTFYQHGFARQLPARKEVSHKRDRRYACLTLLTKQKKDDEDERLLSIFKQIHINLPFLEAMIHMPKGATILKDLLSHKEKLEKEASSVKLNEKCSTIIQRNLPQKEGDPRSFTLPWISKLKPTKMSIQLADRSIKYLVEICENLLVKISKFIFLVDFVVLEMDEDELVSIILGRPFLAMARAEQWVNTVNHDGEWTKEEEGNDPNEVLAEQWVNTVNHDGEWTKEEEGNDPNEVLAVSFYLRTEPVEPLEWKALKIRLKPSSVEPPKLELKELPEHLEYACLQENNQLPMVISSVLSTVKKPNSSSPWVSPVQVIPKKGGMNVVKNEKDELIL